MKLDAAVSDAMDFLTEEIALHHAKSSVKGPLRRCVASGEPRNKAGLIRFALTPNGEPIPDIDEALPGRGFWVAAGRGMVAARATRKRLGRMLRGRTLPVDIDDRLERLLLARCLDMIGLARRAGQAVAGWEKVRSTAERDAVGLVLTARDAGSDGRRRARMLFAAFTHVDCMTGAEIGQPFGRGSMVHVAIGRGRLAQRLVRETARLAMFRQSPETGAPRDWRDAGRNKTR